MTVCRRVPRRCRPSWTDNTDPNVAFDTKGRAYQVTLPFNAFWDGTKLHPDGAIDLSYSDDLGRHWTKGNGGQDLEQSTDTLTTMTLGKTSEAK